MNSGWSMDTSSDQPEDKNYYSVKTIVVGLCNPILGDNGIGWQIARQVQQRQAFPSEVDVDCLSVGGISLMERLIGYERAIMIDSFVTHKNPIGPLLCFSLDELPNWTLGHTCSAHDTTLQNALKMSKDLGTQLPDETMVLAIEAQNVYDFSEKLTPQVATSVPSAVQTIIDL
jgi:hydrogenase maturation protease